VLLSHKDQGPFEIVSYCIRANQKILAFFLLYKLYYMCFLKPIYKSGWGTLNREYTSLKFPLLKK
jgi:hypothetical protein